VIAASSSGQSFGALGAYLVGDESRVGWAETRNMMEGMDGGVIDPDAVAAEMRDEAVASGVAKPVYHIAIAFDPDDHPTEAEVRAAADRTLRDLGLEDHQALIVRHTDQPHAHVHLMVNRVGPDGKAWSTWRDRYRLRSSMEAQERELGVRWTGRNRELEREAPTLDAGAQFRDSGRGFAAEVRAKALADLRESRSWPDLDGRLASHGLRVERRGQEAVVTDGEREAKLSSVSRTVSRRRLEDRLGPLRGRTRQRAAGQPDRLRQDRRVPGAGRPPSAGEAERRAQGRGRPRKHQPSRASGQIRSRRSHVLGMNAAQGKTPTPGRPGLPKGRALLASRIARGGLTALGAGGQPDTDVERRLPRALGRATILAVGTASSQRGTGARTGVEPAARERAAVTPRPSLAARTLAPRAAHRDLRPGGRVDRLAALVAERERGARIESAYGQAASVRARVEARASRSAQRATAQAARASQAFSQALGRVYTDPTAARERFTRLTAREGPGAAAQAMTERPEAFGVLRKTETKRALGLVRGETTEPARSRAGEAARAGAEYVRANESRAGAAARSHVLRSSGGRTTADPAVRAVGARVRRVERALARPDGGPAADRRLRDLDSHIARAAGRIGRVPGGQPLARGASRGARRAAQALAARVGTVGVRVVTQIARATGRGLGRE
jgi:hypothetical protein